MQIQKDQNTVQNYKAQESFFSTRVFSRMYYSNTCNGRVTSPPQQTPAKKHSGDTSCKRIEAKE